MNKITLAALSATLVAGGHAVTFTDVSGDIGVGSFPHLDITQVDVTNTLTDITFVITLFGDPVATNWGKYNMVMRNSSNAAVDNDTISNPWGRNYFLTGGANTFIGTWVDAPSSNQQNWTYNGSWNLNTTGTNSVTSTTVTLTASLADLGLSLGDVTVFDIVSTGGGGSDTAVDSLTGVMPTAWNQNVELGGNSYTVVPEPATMAALGLGAAALLRRRKKA